MWGMLAAASFTTTMFTANRVATNTSSAQRSCICFWWCNNRFFSFSIKSTPFNFEIFLKWELFSPFGTIIPPMLMNAGFHNKELV
jgi:hypothetical protein